MKLVSFDRSNNSRAIDVKMDGFVREVKSYFKRLRLTFSYKLDWGYYIISIVKTASKEIGALICSVEFLSSVVALYPYKSTIRSCMEYWCHAWAGALSCYLEVIDKLQKRICKTFNCCLSWTLGSSSNCSRLKSFLEVLLWQMLIWTDSAGSTSLLSFGRSTRHSDRLHDFSITFSWLLQGCQQFLSSHSSTLELYPCRMLSFDLLSKWL